jgi:hypothetical protein
MTMEEQDAVLGRTMRRYKDAKIKLGAMDASNHELGAFLRKLATAIEQTPGKIHVSRGAEGALRVANAAYIYSVGDADKLTPDSIERRSAEYAEIEQRKAELRQRILDQGQDEPA